MALSTERRKVWIEVLAIYGVAIGTIFVFKLLEFIPFIRENLGGIAGLVFLFLPIEWLYRKQEDPRRFGITWAHLGKGALWAGVLILVTFPLYVPAYELWFNLVSAQHEFHLAVPTSFWKEVVGNFLLVALPEEAFYRGYMQTRLDAVFTRKQRILGAEVGWSVVVTAALFAFGHLVQLQPDKLGTFLPGLVFGWMRAKTGSIGGAVIFHASCNLWAQILHYGYFGVS